MPRSFPVRVLTPMGQVLATRATGLRVSAADGFVGVMAHHAPMVTELAIGSLVVTESEGERRHFAIVGGVMRVKRDEVLLLVEAAEEAEEIDVERARRALERARERLVHGDPAVSDISRAELALARARNRLRVAERGRP